MKFSYLHFKHPNISRTSDELSRSNFSGVYHPQDVRDEKVSLALAHWEHGEMKTLVPSKICGSMANPWKIRGIDGITTELRRNYDGMSP